VAGRRSRCFLVLKVFVNKHLTPRFTNAVQRINARDTNLKIAVNVNDRDQMLNHERPRIVRDDWVTEQWGDNGYRFRFERVKPSESSV